jgi:hypothetical protein
MIPGRRLLTAIHQLVVGKLRAWSIAPALLRPIGLGYCGNGACGLMRRLELRANAFRREAARVLTCADIATRGVEGSLGRRDRRARKLVPAFVERG